MGITLSKAFARPLQTGGTQDISYRPFQSGLIMASKKGARCKIAKKSREKAQRNSEYLSRPTSTPRCEARGEGHSSLRSVLPLPIVVVCVGFCSDGEVGVRLTFEA